jgi:hypothetical protein
MKRKMIRHEPAGVAGAPEPIEPVGFPNVDHMKLNPLCKMACGDRVLKSRARRPALETVIDVFLEKPD